ncbi:MAG: hypothetical protein U9P37_08390 [Pseudomonadota bacterium]|nr:hypothetical protein [Pseudomonadota bacterium]
MKILARLFWVFIIFLFIAELIIFRQTISYHATDNAPTRLVADNQSMPVNRYVSLPAALQAIPPLIIKAPGYTTHVYQHRQNKGIFIYDLDSKLSSNLKGSPELATVEGRLLQLKDAPFSAEVLNHFAMVNNNTTAYALLLNVKPRRSILYLYLAAILLTILLMALCPFLGRASKKVS